jgi:hypothetical protein
MAMAQRFVIERRTMTNICGICVENAGGIQKKSRLLSGINMELSN